MNTNTTPPISPALDASTVLCGFEKAASTLIESDIVAALTGTELLSRLDIVARSPRRIVDVGCGAGRQARALLDRYPKSHLTLLDPSVSLLEKFKPSLLERLRLRNRLEKKCASAESMPFEDATVDMVFANQSLHWCDMAQAFSEIRRVLAPGGHLTFATLGPDTLWQLRAAWDSADSTIDPDNRRVHRFADMHDVGDLLLGSGFSEPVMDMETMTLTYVDTHSLFSELRGAGARNARSDRPRSLTGKQRFARYVQKLDSHRNSDGLIEVSVEIVYGHAWIGDTRPTPATIPVKVIKSRETG